jgi:hypothetical protein
MNSVKKFSVTLAALSAFAVVSVNAATAVEIEAVGQKVAAAKAVEAPAIASKLIGKAAKEDKETIAVAALSAGLRSHPASLTTLLSSVLKAAPESTEALVNTALDIVPDSALTIVRVVSEVNPAKSDVAFAAATKRAPSKKVALEREMAAVRARRIVATTAPAGAALGGGTVNQTPRPTQTPPVQVSSYGAADPGRP